MNSSNQCLEEFDVINWKAQLKEVSQDSIILVLSCIEYLSCMNVYRLIASRVCIKIHDTRYTLHETLRVRVLNPNV